MYDQHMAVLLAIADCNPYAELNNWRIWWHACRYMLVDFMRGFGLKCTNIAESGNSCSSKFKVFHPLLVCVTVIMVGIGKLLCAFVVIV